MNEAVLILSTAGSPEEAARLAEALVAERLAACVQVSPVESWYRWEGRVERATEQRLEIKTRAGLASAAIDRLQALHSYAVPEAVVVPIAGGSDAYLNWLNNETG